VPIPEPQRLASAQQQVEEIIRQHQLAPDRIEGVEWVQKSRGRAGERDSLYLRLYVMSGSLGILAAVLIIGGLIVWNTPSLRGIVFAPTWTPTFTPTLTPTNTPGFTPTPSPTPELTLTPSPTIDPKSRRPHRRSACPNANLPRSRQPPSQRCGRVDEWGEYAIALPTLAKEREAAELSFDAAPYHYAKRSACSVQVMDSALDRLQKPRAASTRHATQFKPLIDTGFAQVYLALAQHSSARAIRPGIRHARCGTTARRIRAISADCADGSAHLALARRYEPESQYNDALMRSTQPEQPGAQSRCQSHCGARQRLLQQDNLDQAAQEAYTALYIDRPLRKPICFRSRRRWQNAILASPSSMPRIICSFTLAAPRVSDCWAMRVSPKATSIWR
jgi:hypothetical protein